MLQVSFRLAASQQETPLLGQNHPSESPECTAVAYLKPCIPVYLSLHLEKLLKVDTVNYQFEVAFDVILSWRDPGAAETLSAAEATWRQQLAATEAARASCAAALAASNGTRGSPACTTAATTADAAS